MSPALAGRFFITEPSGKPLLGEEGHLSFSCNGTGLDIHQRLNVYLFKDEKLRSWHSVYPVCFATQIRKSYRQIDIPRMFGLP